MSELVTRPFAGDEDLPAIVELTNRCAARDPWETATSIEELRADYSSPRMEPLLDNLMIHQDGRLVGASGLWRPATEDRVDSFVWMVVDPDADADAIEPLMVHKALDRVREISRQRKLPWHLAAAVKVNDTARAARLERLGFAPERYMFRMSRPLDLPIDEPRFPDGFTCRPLLGVSEAGKWAEMFNLSFVDHWNFHPCTVDQREHDIRVDPNYTADGDLVCVAPDGTLCGFCDCVIFASQNAQSGRSEGWIHLLGTRRGYRRQGLGRAMLLRGLQWLKSKGMVTALLGVDAESPTGATRLYESAGFSVVHKRTIYSRSESGG